MLTPEQVGATSRDRARIQFVACYTSWTCYAEWRQAAGEAKSASWETKPMDDKKLRELTTEELDHVSGGSNANHPPGTFPAGNPAQAPSNSNPNEHPK